MKSVPLLLALLGLCACQPSIGDSCKTSLDCSATGSRLCDRTQPYGYCTLPGCDKGSCPSEAVCVLFRPAEPRLSSSYCMYACDNTSDCRDDEGYACLGQNDFGVAGEMEAQVLDGSKKRFCARRALPYESIADAGTDAALDGSVGDAAAK